MGGFDTPITYDDPRILYGSANVSYDGNPLLTGSVSGVSIAVIAVTLSPNLNGAATGATGSAGLVTGIMGHSGSVTGSTATSGSNRGAPQFTGVISGATTSNGSVAGYEGDSGLISGSTISTGLVIGTPYIPEPPLPPEPNQTSGTLPLMFSPEQSKAPYLTFTATLSGISIVTGGVTGMKRIREDDDVEVFTLLGLL